MSETIDAKRKITSFVESRNLKTNVAINRAQSLPPPIYDDNKRTKILRRNQSLVAFEELVECGICLCRLENPKMLHCQHTFCFKCLEEMWQKTNSSPNESTSITCPLCQKETTINDLYMLPGNLYVNSLLGLLHKGSPEKSDSSISKDSACFECKMICKDEMKCTHCQLIFCKKECYEKHADELADRISNFQEQLAKNKMRLEYELLQYKRHTEQLADEIHDVIDQKIKNLQDLEVSLGQEVETMFETCSKQVHGISTQINFLIGDGSETQKDINNSDDKVARYMDCQKKILNMSEVLSNVLFDYKSFNETSLQLESNGKCLSPSWYGQIDSNNVDQQMNGYKDRQFRQPKLSFHKLQKPTGLCASPWYANEVYICNMQIVYTFNISTNKITSRLEHEEMLCAQSIACNSKTSEIFVSDQWKNCIHVFDQDGSYKRKLSPNRLSSPHGITLTKDGDLLVCDTGNNRVILVNSISGQILNVLGIIDNYTEFSKPTDVGTDGRIIAVADTGNNRIKVFDAVTLKRLHVFGRSGKFNGEIHTMQVLHVDAKGHILVGDSGNKRLQIFDTNGNFVKSSSTEYKFTSITGLCTNANLDIIVADARSKAIFVF